MSATTRPRCRHLPLGSRPLLRLPACLQRSQSSRPIVCGNRDIRGTNSVAEGPFHPVNTHRNSGYATSPPADASLLNKPVKQTFISLFRWVDVTERAKLCTL